MGFKKGRSKKEKLRRSKELATACPPWRGESVRMADKEHGAEGGIKN
jgi:hypothetical protein